MPVLNTVKVPSDPAQICSHHASFRVELPGPLPVSRALSVGLGAPAVAAALPAAPRTRRRRAVVWSGRTSPGDARTRQLLQAVADRTSAHRGVGDAPATQVLPRVVPAPGAPSRGDDAETTPAGGTAAVVGPRSPQPQPAQLLVRPRRGEGDGEPAAAPSPAVVPPSRAADATRPLPTVAAATPQGAAARTAEHGPTGDAPAGTSSDGAADAAVDTARTRRPAARRGGRFDSGVRHAYYPGHRMNLGLVLLPLRIFLGFSSLYAGMGKLTNPAFFEGGERGSIVAWLESLEPWAVAAPLLDFAVAHPVGAGLTVAFLQIVIGVLTLLGLWQRLAATIGVLLCAVLIVTVSWRAAPAYDVPDLVYLAAWSPLAIAGAPVFSLDARLAGEAWRRLGPRVSVWRLRQRVLRRGALVATLVVGLSLLTGSLLGGAVRSSQVATVPGPDDPPVNRQPGSPLPERPGTPSERSTREPDDGRPTGRAESDGPTATPGPDHTARPDAGTDVQQTPQERPAAPTPPPAAPPPPPRPRTPESVPSAGGGPQDGQRGGVQSPSASGSGSEEPGRDDEPSPRGALGGLLG